MSHISETSICEATKPDTEGLREAISGLLDSEEFSDLTITCQHSTYKVHRNVVCAQSPFFKNACKKDTFKEGNTAIIDLPDDDPHAVQSMVEFFYAADYIDPNLTTCLLHHVQTYILADKCSALRLKKFASSKLFNEANRLVITHESDLAAATRYAYENNPLGDTWLKCILVGVIARRMDIYLDDKNGPISTLMAELGEVGRDVARAVRFFACEQQLNRSSRTRA